VSDRVGSVNSTALHERAARTIPGGVNSNIRLSAPAVFFECGKGAMLWDVDGNDYVDYVLGQGPNFLGHANARINSAVAEACTAGMVFGAQHRLEVEAAELLLATVGWAQMVRLSMTGTEAVQAALRLARASTGRRKFLRFEGHYHGWLDNVLLDMRSGRPTVASAGQLESSLGESVVVAWNDAAAVEAALRADEIAAVIMEPVMINTGSVEPRPGYLEQVRELCSRYGSVLIFDEVITGFRVAAGGAAQRYGVTPDLAVYGKAMAGGWPVAALAGRADLMAEFGTGRVNHSGTFNGSVMAAAAVVATQRLLTDEPPYQAIEEYGNALKAGLVAVAESHGLPFRVQGLPMAFHASFGDAEPFYDLRGLQRRDGARYAALARTLAQHGVWVAGRGIWYVSAAHGQDELRTTIERFDKALSEGHP
jgi:glutamate-1-semialdehyde 2,1-aminomutase